MASHSPGGGVFGAGGRWETRVETISFSGSVKKHTRGRERPSAPVNPQEARARPLALRGADGSARWCVCLHLVGEEDGELRLNVTCWCRRGLGRGCTLPRTASNAHLLQTGAAVIFPPAVLKNSPSSVAPRTNRSVFTRTSFAKTEPTVWLRSARAMTLGGDCVNLTALTGAGQNVMFIFTVSSVPQAPRPWWSSLSLLSFTLGLSLTPPLSLYHLALYRVFYLRCWLALPRLPPSLSRAPTGLLAQSLASRRVCCTVSARS